jgi:Family of unknown function (DUF6510)
MTDTPLDGNGVAGLLAEILAAEPTTTLRRCQSCGDEQPLAAHRAYQGAGMVLRCPSCTDVAVRIIERDDGLMVEWRGVYTVPRAG